MNSNAYRYVRRKLIEYGLYPQSIFAQITVYLAVVELFLYLLRAILTAAGRTSGAAALDGWVTFLGFVVVVLVFVATLRWIRTVLMWRLRNRLIVTYVFIGVIPLVLLMTIAVGAAYLFSGQFATYIVADELQTQMTRLDSVNRAITSQVAARLNRGETLDVIAQNPNLERRGFGERSIEVVYGDNATKIVGTDFQVPNWVRNQEFHGLVLDGTPYLRAADSVKVRGKALTVVSSIPVDENMVERIASRFSQVEFDYAHGSEVVYTNPEYQQVGIPGASGKLRAGSVPPPGNRFDTMIGFVATYPYTRWATGPNEKNPDLASIYVATRPSALLGRVTETSGLIGGVVVDMLIGVAILFGVIELIALAIGIRLTRTVTRSVAQLYSATQRINRGDLTYRIQVTSKDQLAALEGSFNSMSDSLEKLMAEQREKQRLENELAIAQEVQAQLFPQREKKVKSLSVHGICQPARVVSGDYYDFLPIGENKLAIAVGDISGKGISAALLMATIHSAVRAYEFGHMPQPRELMAAGAAAVRAAVGADIARPLPEAMVMESPAAVLWLLNRHLFHSTPTEKYATLFLGLYDGVTRRLVYSNAGHLPPLVLGRDGSIRKLTAGGTVIGLFEGPTWNEEAIQLEPGDLILAYSDGVTEPENDFGEFGEERLLQTVKERREQPLEQIAEAVVDSVKDWIGGNEQPDDITVVLARTL